MRRKNGRGGHGGFTRKVLTCGSIHYSELVENVLLVLSFSLEFLSHKKGSRLLHRQNSRRSLYNR